MAIGASVICDRYVDSSVAYQGVGRGLGLERVLELNLDAVGGLLPDRTFLLLLDPAETHTRLTGDHDRLEREGQEFRALVDAGYRELAVLFPERIVALVGADPVNLLETLAARIADDVLTDPRVEQAVVTVHKPSAPITVPFADVSVTIRRTRPAPRAVPFGFGVAP